MKEPSVGVIKKDRVKLSGSPGEPASPNEPDAPSCATRITEMGKDFAIIQVTCLCGQTSYLRCEFDPPAGTP